MMGRWVTSGLLVFLLAGSVVFLVPGIRELRQAVASARHTESFVRCTWPLWDLAAVVRAASVPPAWPLQQRAGAVSGCADLRHLTPILGRIVRHHPLDDGQRLLLETTVEERLAAFRSLWTEDRLLGNLWRGFLADYERTWTTATRSPEPPWEQYRSRVHRLRDQTLAWARRARAGLVWRVGSFFLLAAGFVLAAVLAARESDRRARMRLARWLQPAGATDAQRPPAWAVMEDRIRDMMTAMGSDRAESESSEWFLHAQQMTVATFVHETLHEIKQPLTVIQGYVQLLMQQAGDGPMRQDLEAIEQQIVRLMQFVRHLNQFRTGAEEHAEWLEMDRVLRPLARILEPVLARQGIAFELDLAPLPRVYLSPGQLQQLVWNLVVNAQEALQDWSPPAGEKRRIRLRVRHFHPVMAGLRRTEEMACGLTVVVEDNGPGMPEAVRERVLQPFYTTKKRAHVGLGLAICQRIVEQHGGRIEIRSVPERGTTVRVWWPCVKAHPGAGSTPEQVPQQE